MPQRTVAENAPTACNPNDMEHRRITTASLLGALVCGLLTLQCMGPRQQAARPPGSALASWPIADGTLPQTDDDESTTYELLTPGSGEFHVRYEVSATTPGHTAYYNILRKGSGVRDWHAVDLYSGDELPIEIATGFDAREDGHPSARPDVEYLRIELARPVPEGGQTRLAIEKVYGDPSGYFLEDGLDNGQVVFARVMNIKRNAVVLPPDYELIQCNHPTRISTEPDGRVRVSFTKTGQSPVFLVLRSRPLIAWTQEGEEDPEAQETIARNASAPLTLEDEDTGVDTPPAVPAELRTIGRDRELLIDLGDPRRGAFRTLHDFTESEAGLTSREISPAPPGTVARATALLLDTGVELDARVAKTDGQSGSQGAVVVEFPTIDHGQSLRIRVEELRLDRSSYRIEDGALVWRARADSALRTLLLPAGWYVTENTVPAVVAETHDGRVRLDYATLSGDDLFLTVRARRRPAE